MNNASSQERSQEAQPRSQRRTVVGAELHRREPVGARGREGQSCPVVPPVETVAPSTRGRLRRHEALADQAGGQGVNWLFTSYLGREEVKGLVEKAVAEGVVKWCVFQTERCPTTQRIHQQGYFILFKKRRRHLITFLPGAHLVGRDGSHEQAKTYCTKEDTRVAEGIFFGDEPQSHQGKRNDIAGLQAAIRSGASLIDIYDQFPEECAKFSGFVDRYRSLLRTESILEGLPQLVPRPGWQSALHELLGGPPTPRMVHWRYEETGNVGKSFFATHYRPRSTFLIFGSKWADVIHAYDGEPLIILDWCRSAEESFPYGLIEQFQNGAIFSGKYQSVLKRFVPPRIVVFANFRPIELKLSLDRWDIVEISE